MFGTKSPVTLAITSALLLLSGLRAIAIEIIKDNSDGTGVTITGSWTTSTWSDGYNGTNYFHDGNAGKGSKSIRFTPNIPVAGQYHVFGRWIAGSDRSATVPITVTHAGGSATLQVNQRINGAQWFLLGTYNFGMGTDGSVLISNTGTTGFVVADAIRFVSTDEIIKDNTDATGVTITGSWPASASVTGFIGTNYIHDNNSGKGTKSILYVPTIPAAGSYAAYLRWTAGTDRAANVPVNVTHAGGTALLQVDQRTSGGKWVLLGSYNFNTDTGGSILVSNTGTTGSVIADSVRLVPGPPDQDSDGMPDSWETANGLNPDDPNDGPLDPDGDGQTNLQEFLAGTNPNVNNATSTVTASIQTISGYELEGTAAAVRINRTGGTSALTVNFSRSGIAGTADYTPKNSSGTTLTGSITIPAGASSATILLHPTSDGLDEYPETATITITSGSGYTIGGTASATVTIKDATNVRQNEQLFVAYLAPVAGTGSTASGVATLMLSGAKDSARVGITFYGLGSNQTNSYIRYGVSGGAGPELRPNLGIGQLTDVIWNIVPSPPYSGQQIIDGLFKVGGRYVYTNIGSTNHPGGEIQGTWARQTGSATFNPPANPPSIPPLTGDDLTRDVARFLTQATFGPTKAEIDALVNSVNTAYAGNRIAAFSAWIDTQLAYDQTTITDYVKAVNRREKTLRGVNPDDPTYGVHNGGPRNAWWLLAIRARDQLRQRFAFSASEIWVISTADFVIHSSQGGYSNYYDMLGSYASGNFRDLIESVSKHPMMGQYLSSLKNQKAIVNSSGIQIVSPDENYAREIMQLFTIGLVKRHPDGSLQIGSDGLPLYTYDNTDIQNLARVFTGWSYSKTVGPTAPWPTLDNNDFNMTAHSGGKGREATTNPMKNFAAYHDTGSKIVLGTVIPAGLDGETDLDAALDILHNHPSTPPFISRLLIQRLVTSNPSNGYIYRVSQKFINNGSGVRGDMKAVLKAILLDYEARSLSLAMTPGFGKQKEPIMRHVQRSRAFNVQSNLPLSNLNAYGYPASQFDNFPPNTTHLCYDETQNQLGQTPIKAPSVFNWFLPDYTPGGAISAAGLVAPEMQLSTENAVINVINSQQMTGAKFSPFDIMYAIGDTTLDDFGVDVTDLVPVYDAAIATGQTIPQATTAALDYLDIVMLSGMLKARYESAPTPNPRSILIDGVSSLSTTSTLTRMRELAYLVLVSPEYIHQK